MSLDFVAEGVGIAASESLSVLAYHSPLLSEAGESLLEVEAIGADREVPCAMCQPHQGGKLRSPNGLLAGDPLLGQGAKASGAGPRH